MRFNNYGGDFDDFCRRQATGWAAATLTQAGCTLESEPNGGWWVRIPEGNEFLCVDWQDLCRMAKEVQS